MIAQKILRFWLTPKNNRFISQTSRCFDSKNVEPSVKSSSASGQSDQSGMSMYSSNLIIYASKHVVI